MPRALAQWSPRAATGALLALASTAFVLWTPGCGRADSPPKVELQIEVKGQGSVTPDSGLYEPGSEVTLTAKAEPNWAFDRWSGDLDGGVDRYAERISFTVESPMRVSVQFIERPGLTDLNMASDLNAFLRYIGSSERAETFDRNHFRHDIKMNRVYEGNGMPDVAELYLVETILKNRHLDFTHRSGVCHELVWEAWQKNLAQARKDMPIQNAPIVRIVAAYMTIGDFDTVESLRDLLITSTTGVRIDPQSYDRSAQRYLTSERDADNDGVPNIAEWVYASPDGSLKNLEAYGQAATDGLTGDITPEEVTKIMLERMG